MRKIPTLALTGVLTVGMLTGMGCASDASKSTAMNTVATQAQDVRPVEEGQRAPAAQVRTMDGNVVNLTEIYKKQPTVLVFYRGGWCPYCVKQLSGLGQVAGELEAQGYQIVAISPDSPTSVQAMQSKTQVKYQVLSDADANAIKAFGLAFRVDDPTITKYKGYGINLEEASGQDHHLLPVPAVYLIDTRGKIHFAFWDADYRNRLDHEKLLAAAKNVAGK